MNKRQSPSIFTSRLRQPLCGVLTLGVLTRLVLTHGVLSLALALLLLGVGVPYAAAATSTAAAASEPDAGQLFFEANQAYKDGDYARAARLYGRITQSGRASGHVYYNLGNAYFRLGEPGQAVLNYERARSLIPRDADLRFNLAYARERTRDAVDPPAPPLSTTFFWLERFSLDEVLLVFCVLNALFFAALMLRLAFKREWTFTLALTLTAVWLIGGASLGVKAFQALHDSRAVIVARAAAVLAGPDPQDTVLFELHAGTVVESERREEGWTLIRFSTDKRGWVESAHLAPIRPRGAEDAPASIPRGQGSGPG